MTAIVTPLPSSTMRSAFFKLGGRRYLVISIVMVAVALDVVDGIVRDARMAVGACSVVAQRRSRSRRRGQDRRGRGRRDDRRAFGPTRHLVAAKAKKAAAKPGPSDPIADPDDDIPWK
jgi:CO/xanthine dehydrogenase FAD-binding subunit